MDLFIQKKFMISLTLLYGKNILHYCSGTLFRKVKKDGSDLKKFTIVSLTDIGVIITFLKGIICKVY